MKTCNSLTEFCRELLRYVGRGYKFSKVVKVKEEKFKNVDVLSTIKSKIENHYGTNLTRGKRQWNRLKDRANFGAVSYRNLIVIVKTSGTISQSGINENEFRPIAKNELVLSEYIGLILFQVERQKWTYRLTRETYHRIKGEYQLAFKNFSGKNFHTLQKMWRGLPNYMGIGKQRKELNKSIIAWQKTYKVKWYIRF